MNRRNGEQINKWTQQPITMGKFQKYDICIIENQNEKIEK